MATIIDLLADLLNPNPGQNRLVAPNANGPNYLAQTGLGPEQLARFHQMSGMGGQAAPATSMPQAAPPAAVGQQQAPQPDQVQTASVAPPQAGGGGFLSRLFGGGQADGENQTIQWLQQQGMDPGMATMMAKSKPALQQYLLDRSQGADPMKQLQAEKLALEVEQMKHPKPDETKLPSSYQEFQLAKQDGSFAGNYTDWQTKSARNQDAGFKNEMDLRKEYTTQKVVEDYNNVRAQYERIRSSAAEGTGAGDIGMVFSYMKMLDPTSTVARGEQASAQSAAGVPSQVVGIYNQLIGGGSLDAKARSEFLKAADNFYKETAGNLSVLNKDYTGYASAYKLDPTRIVITPEDYEPLVPVGVDPAVPLPGAAVAQPAPGGVDPKSSTRKIYDGLATGDPAAAKGWREVAPGIKLRKVN